MTRSLLPAPVPLARIHILVPCLSPHDAIGNDVAQMREALSADGYDVEVLAETIHPNCSHIARPLAKARRSQWRSADSILIYHHAIGWPSGEHILATARNRVIVRYHNITPPRFFASHSMPHVRACEAGIESIRRLARLGDVAFLCASSFNCGDLIAYGAAPDACNVLPPLHATEDLAREPFDIPTLERYSGHTVNILFVGGIKPNKGHARAIGVLAAYQRQYHRRSRLIFAGGIEDCFRGYLGELRLLAASLGVGDSVDFTGSVSAGQLKTLYTAADVFLCTSEHEGFCVPLVEAMYFRLPIVAWARTAVPETVGDCGFLIEDWDESLFASKIAMLVDNLDLAGRFGLLGRRRYQEAYSSECLRRRLCDMLANVAGPSTASKKVRVSA